MTTFRQALKSANEVFVFAVIRCADDSDSVCGYLPVSKRTIRYEMKHGWLKSIDPQFILEDGVLSIG